MSIKRKIKNIIKDILRKNYSKYLKIYERKKIKEKRRIQIYKNTILTKEQKKEIDKLYKNNYGRKIPYSWHREYTSYTNKFDKNYFPELLYIPEFEYFMNYNKSLADVIEDKNILPILAKTAGIKMPKTLLSCQEGIFKDKEGNIIEFKYLKDYIKDIGECFIKPSIDSNSGVNCRLINIIDYKDKISNKSIDLIFSEVGENFIIQEKIICSNSIRNIYPNSVNTFRVMTYRWKNKFYVMPIIMRIGQKNSIVDNAHAGGMFIAIENNGLLHKTAFTEFKDEYNEHPDTKVKFYNYKINNFEKIIDAALVMHKTLPTIGVVSWDFTIDNNENPVLIEGNVNGGSIWLIQMAHGKGAFGDKTKEILMWLNKVKNGKAKYYGN